MKEQKAIIRRTVRLRDHSGENAAALWLKVEALPQFQSASTVMAYSSLDDEVPTIDFINKWCSSKRIALPLVVGEDMVLKLYEPSRLRAGYRGIMEPYADAPEINPSEVDFALVPGVAFDMKGGRLGRGKGFYDRFLPRLGCPTAGVAFRAQIVDSVPTDPWDVPLSMVLTP